LASGSGFAVAKNIVATNAHVVEGAFPDEISVKHGKENDAAQRITRVLYFDRARDLCLMEGEMDLKPLAVRSNYVLQPEDPVVLMGNPSLKGAILMRNVTHRGKLRTLVHIEGQDLYHIDADVNPGWSGGPVLDDDGKVIAVVVMKADDAVVAEIRGAMQKLDDDFRAGGAGAVKGGITYGIPASTLAKILEDGTLKDTQRQTVANDRYVARTLLDRLQFLAELAMLRMAVNVPLQVRLEAKAFTQGDYASRSNRFSTVKVEYVALMPEKTAIALAALLRSHQLQEIENQFCKTLDARLDAVAESPNVAADVKRDMKSLAKKIKDTTAFAERPANTYAAYSVKVNAFSRDLKGLLKRLEKNVDDKEQ
jgi:hypothetical protein